MHWASRLASDIAYPTQPDKAPEWWSNIIARLTAWIIR